MDTRPIGVLSSGLGGLTVLDELTNALPGEKFIFFADALRVPYGNKSTEEIIDYALQMTQWLVSQDAKVIVVSCNILSSLVLPILRSQYTVPFIGITEAGVETVLKWEELTGQTIHHLGLIGSSNTISSRAHENRLRTAGFMGKITTSSCPLFLPILKAGVMDKNIWNAVIQYYLSPLRDAGIDGLLFASTGYSLLTEHIQEFFNGKTQIFNPNYWVAKELKDFVTENNLISGVNTISNQVSLYTTGSLQVFDFFVRRFFEFSAGKITVVPIEEVKRS